MRRRVVELVGPRARAMWVSTFHSACVRILRRHAVRLGYRRASPSTTTPTPVGWSSSSAEDLGVDPKRLPPRSVLGADQPGQVRPARARPTYRRRPRPIYDRRIADVYELYERRLSAANAMDFDDLLVNTVRLLRDHPDVLEHYQQRFPHVLVDEYQDTNPAQDELVHALAGGHRNVVRGGRPDQSIYRFRAADVRNILDFEQAFPDATVVCSSRTSAPPRRSSTRRTRSSPTTCPQAEDAVDRRRGRRPDHPLPRRRRARRGRRGSPTRSSRLHAEDGAPLGRRRGLLPDQRAEPRPRGGACPRGRPLPGGRRHPLLRPTRGQDVLAYLRVLVNPDDEVAGGAS